MARINPEVRAAEIVAAIHTDYRDGGWFECMTRGEQIGWNKRESEWWWGAEWATNGELVPRNAREWAGWLACDIHLHDTYPSAHDAE